MMSVLSRLFFTFVFVSSVVAPVLASPASSKVGQIKFDFLDNRIFADVWLNGKGPFKFIFDTGGNNSMTYDLATKLNLNVKPSGEGLGAGSGRQKMGETKVESFRIGEIEMKSQSFIVLDYSKIQKAFNFPALDGIFGLEVLRKYLTVIDYENRTLAFHSSPVSFNSVGFKKIGFELLFDKPFINCSVNGVRSNTLIDTGDRSALTVTKQFRSNKEIESAFMGKLEVLTGFGIGGPIMGKVSALDHLQISEEMELNDVAARAPTADGGFNAVKELDSSVGNEVLKQFTIAFDYRGKSLYLKKNKDFGKPTKFTDVPILQ